jgi:hypothetical protein
MVSRSWFDRLWLGLAVFVGIAFAMVIGPAYLRPLPLWEKALITVVGVLSVSTLAIYNWRRSRRPAWLVPRRRPMLARRPKP